MLLKSLFILTLISVVCCQLSQPKCPDVPVLKNLEKDKYSGEWYKIHHSDDSPEDHLKSTINKTNNTHFDMLNESIKKGRVEMKHNNLMKATDSSDAADGKLVLECHEEKSVTNFWILDTNYNSYSLVLLCSSNNDSTYNVSSSIFSRKPFLAPLDILAINDYLKSNGNKSDALKWEKMKPVDQHGVPCNGGISNNNKIISLIALCLIISKVL